MRSPARPLARTAKAAEAIKHPAASQKAGVRLEALHPALKGPVRTCVACRQPAMRGELVRMVEGPDGAIAIDARARAAGRGAWVHPTRGCITTAAKRHAAERSLKVPARDVDGEALVRETADAFRRKARALLSSAQRRRALVLGAVAVAEVLAQRRVPLVLLATDAGESVSRSVAAAENHEGGTRVRALGTKLEIGSAVGRGEVAVAAVEDPGIAAELVSTIDRLAGLEG